MADSKDKGKDKDATASGWWTTADNGGVIRGDSLREVTEAIVAGRESK